MPHYLLQTDRPDLRPSGAPDLIPPVRTDGEPYAIGAAIVRALVPYAPHDLVDRHDIELRTVGLDFPVRRETLFNATPPAERTRIHSRFRTLRVAHGLTDFVRDVLLKRAAGPRTLVIENLRRADATDRELVAVLLRRVNPGLLTLVVHIAPGAIDPAFADHAVIAVRDDGRPDERVEADTDVRALAEAQGRSSDMAFHHSSADLGRRGRALSRPGDAYWWDFTRRMATSLTLLGCTEEAEALYEEAPGDPAARRVAAYELAMLYARHHPPERRDYERARVWCEEAVAIASSLPEPDRTFYTVFYRNGLALIMMRLGDPAAALRLVDDGLDRLTGHPLDRCSLLSNRARVLALLGRGDEACKAYDELVALDPDYAEYRFDRGNLLHDLGLDALPDYDAAVELGLPVPEVHFNRATVLAAAGRTDEALADLDRVLELDPGYLDAYVNRAGLLAGRSDPAAANDVHDGLALDPGNPYLTCVFGQLELAAGRPAAARAAFDAAAELPVALACRAALSYQEGDAEAAADDLTRALAAGEEPGLLFNRAVAFRASGRYAEAVADLRRALELAPGDADAERLLAEIQN